MIFYYLCAIFTLISAAVSLGFSIDAYLKARSEKGATKINAKYAFSRSLSLFIVASGLLLFVSDTYLIAVSTAMICVQLLDGIIGTKISKFKLFGPILTAICNAVLLAVFLINS